MLTSIPTTLLVWGAITCCFCCSQKNCLVASTTLITPQQEDYKKLTQAEEGACIILFVYFLGGTQMSFCHSDKVGQAEQCESLNLLFHALSRYCTAAVRLIRADHTCGTQWHDVLESSESKLQQAIWHNKRR